MPLHEARQIWRALLLAGVEVPSAQWQEWADAQLLVEQEPVPWLLALSTAPSTGTALAALEHDIGLEAECSLDPAALVIGFVVERHRRGELSHESMWVRLREVADIAQFLDSGKWMRYGTEVEVQEAQADSSFIRCLTPVASYAIEKLFLLVPAADGV